MEIETRIEKAVEIYEELKAASKEMKDKEALVILKNGQLNDELKSISKDLGLDADGEIGLPILMQKMYLKGKG